MFSILQASKKNVRNKNPEHLGINFKERGLRMINSYLFTSFDVIKEMNYLTEEDFDIGILKKLELFHKRKEIDLRVISRGFFDFMY